MKLEYSEKTNTLKGFNLERGLPVEETGAKNLKIEELKKITNIMRVKDCTEKITQRKES